MKFELCPLVDSLLWEMACPASAGCSLGPHQWELLICNLWNFVCPFAVYSVLNLFILLNPVYSLAQSFQGRYSLLSVGKTPESPGTVCLSICLSLRVETTCLWCHPAVPVQSGTPQCLAAVAFSLLRIYCISRFILVWSAQHRQGHCDQLTWMTVLFRFSQLASCLQ